MSDVSTGSIQISGLLMNPDGSARLGEGAASL